jgi:diacylglycerol kinase family enzyme
MRANLIYNPNSGSSNQVTPEDLLNALASAGYEPVYTATSSEEDLDRLLPDAEGLVVAVGGDGTIRATATRLIGRNLPIAIVPAGTANNIGHTLGIAGSPVEIISRLKSPVRQYVDIGQVTSPWGVDYFLESFGYGLFADLLYYYEPEKGKSILRSISAAVQRLSNPHLHPGRVLMDAVDISEDYLLLEVLNTSSMGPQVKLAPAADPCDGVFDVVRINESNRDSLLAYVNGLLTESLEELPSVEVSRCHRIEILLKGLSPFTPMRSAAATYEQARGGPARGNTWISHYRWSGVIEILPPLEVWLRSVGSPAQSLPAKSVRPDLPKPPVIHRRLDWQEAVLFKDERTKLMDNSDQNNLIQRRSRRPTTGGTSAGRAGGGHPAGGRCLPRGEPGKMKIDLHCHSEASLDSSTAGVDRTPLSGESGAGPGNHRSQPDLGSPEAQGIGGGRCGSIQPATHGDHWRRGLYYRG